MTPERIRTRKTKPSNLMVLHGPKSTRASIALGELQHAMQRGHTNGDMEAALKYAADVKHSQRDFLAEQGIHNIFDD
ncbi:MAG: hypothetical protein ACLU9S_20510 [Oscillospiraceae bacterium]